MMTIDETLKDRGSKYGTFESNAEMTQSMMTLINNNIKIDTLDYPMHMEALHMICHKLSRIVNGDPNYADSWVDIAGYAQLMANYLTPATAVSKKEITTGQYGDGV